MEDDFMHMVLSGTRVAEASTGVALFAAITDGGAVSVAAAIVSVGAIVVPRVIDWYRAIAAVQRENHAAALKLDSDILAAEVRKRVELEEQLAHEIQRREKLQGELEKESAKRMELETECAKLKEETSRNRHRIAGNEQTITNLMFQLKKLDENVDHRLGKLGENVEKLGDKVKSITPDPDTDEFETKT